MGLSGCSLHPGDRPAGRKGLEGSGSTGGSGDCQEAGAGRPGLLDLDGGFPHWSCAGEKCTIQQAGEAGGWDVSHLASRSRWGWS